MMFEDSATDAFGHAKLGGIGDLVSGEVQEHVAKYNNGKTVNIINQKLGYLVRGGDPDAIDSIVPMAYGNLALDLMLSTASRPAGGAAERPLRQHPHRHRDSTKKMVNVEEHYNTERLRPHYKSFEGSRCSSWATRDSVAFTYPRSPHDTESDGASSAGRSHNCKDDYALWNVLSEPPPTAREGSFLARSTLDSCGAQFDGAPTAAAERIFVARRLDLPPPPSNLLNTHAHNSFSRDVLSDDTYRTTPSSGELAVA